MIVSSRKRKNDAARYDQSGHCTTEAPMLIKEWIAKLAPQDTASKVTQEANTRHFHKKPIAYYTLDTRTTL